LALAPATSAAATEGWIIGAIGAIGAIAFCGKPPGADITIGFGLEMADSLDGIDSANIFEFTMKSRLRWDGTCAATCEDMFGLAMADALDGSDCANFVGLKTISGFKWGGTGAAACKDTTVACSLFKAAGWRELLFAVTVVEDVKSIGFLLEIP